MKCSIISTRAVNYGVLHTQRILYIKVNTNCIPIDNYNILPRSSQPSAILIYSCILKEHGLFQLHLKYSKKELLLIVILNSAYSAVYVEQY